MKTIIISALLALLSASYQASAAEPAKLKIEIVECHVDAPERLSHLSRLFPNTMVLSEEYYLTLTKDGENSSRRFISLDLRQRQASTNPAMTDVSWDFEPVFSVEVNSDKAKEFSLNASDLIVDFLPQIFPVPTVTGTFGSAILKSKVRPNNSEIRYPEQIQFTECLFF